MNSNLILSKDYNVTIRKYKHSSASKIYGIYLTFKEKAEVKNGSYLQVTFNLS